MADMLSSGVVPSLVASGDVGLDALDYDMAYTTYRGSYDNDLVTQLAGAWSGNGSGTQEMSEASGISAGTVELTNTTDATIEVAAQGASFTATDGSTYETDEQPTNTAWSNGTGQTGNGYYAVTPGQTITVPVEATFQGDDAGSDAAGSITASSVGGITVSQPDALSPGSAYTNPADNTLGGWLTKGFGEYSFVFTDQGLSPAEAHVNVDAGMSWTSAIVASWDGYVANARSVGILNVAPLESGAVPQEDPTQPFATSAFYAGIRSAALYGGGLEIELSPWYWLHESASEQQTVIEEIRWCTDHGLRASILVNSQMDYTGDPDPNFATDTIATLRQLQAEDALPSQVVLENDNGTDTGYYYDADTSDANSLNAVALDVAHDFSFTPSASEDGLEVRGTSTAQTTLIMAGVQPTENVASGSFAPYAETQVFSEDPSSTLTLTVIDTKDLLFLSDSLDGGSTGPSGTLAFSGPGGTLAFSGPSGTLAFSGPSGTLAFSGTAAQATMFLADLSAEATPGTIGVAQLSLTLTDDLGETTACVTSVNLGRVQPVFTDVTDTASVTGPRVHTGDTVTFALATSDPVTVAGAPTLLLTNERIATYAGQDSAGDLLFSYTVQAGDDTAALRVRGLRLDGATITDISSGLALDPDSIDVPEAAMANPLAVDTRTDTIIGVSETASASGLLGAGDVVTFLLTANNPITTVVGTPTLWLNDGGTATYAGLSSTGQLEFTYAVPSGGAFDDLAPSSSYMNGATFTNDLGEPVDIPYTLPTTTNDVSYDATDPTGIQDTLVVALSADEYLGDADAVISINGQQVGSTIDVSAIHSDGQTQLITITGDFGSSISQLGITFTNDLYAGTSATDRNLYVDGVTLNGVSELSATALYATSTVLTPLAPVAKDELQLWVNEDAAAGNATFSVAVDGKLLGGTYSTDVAHSSGQWQEVDIYGNIGAGPHTVTATFLNNAWDGSLDRLLFVKQIGIDGTVETTPNQALYATGSSTTVTIPAPAEDTLTLDVSEDAYLGDAQCYVTIDGNPFGGITTVTASHAAGAEQAITINAAGLSTGTHTIGLAFINDAYGGAPSLDRNLYLDSVQLNGVDQDMSAILDHAGTAFFQVGSAASSGVTVEGAASLLSGFATTVVPGAFSSSGAGASAIGALHLVTGAVGQAGVLIRHA